MYSFELTPDERRRAVERRAAFLALGTEDDYTTIVHARSLTRSHLKEMLARIDEDVKNSYGLHPHQIARYGGIEGVLNYLRLHHPDIQQFHLQYVYFMDVLLLREESWKRLRHVIALKRFAMRAVPSFLEHYYRPPWGRGCRAAIRRLKAGI